jgi:Uma2 family endonuclease
VPEVASPPVVEPSVPKAVSPAPRPLHSHTAEEYLFFERNSPTQHEYYAGTIYAITGASRRHVLIVANLTRGLGNRLEDRPCEIYPSEMRVRVDATGLYTYPDLSIVCGEPRFDDTQTDTLLNPQVVIEVLSKSTNDYDLGDKFDHYRSIDSVSDYVLVAQDSFRVEHRSRQPDGTWLVTTHEDPGAVLALKSVGCDIPLSEIYRRIKLGA